MPLLDLLTKLANEKSQPCVTISLNTSRTHPDNNKDIVLIKNLLNEAKERVIEEYGKRTVSLLLENLNIIEEEIDVNYNLDSLHIFLSNETKKIIKSTIPVAIQGVQISDSFALRPIIKFYNRSKTYLVLLLSQSGVHLYEALNDQIIHEIKNADFPFSENNYYNTHSDKGSDAKHMDDLVRQFLNKVDKAIVSVNNAVQLNCVVICTEDNYSRLLQVADKPSIYTGFAPIDYNHQSVHHISKQAWELTKLELTNQRIKAVAEIQESVSTGNVFTDLQEIFQASLDGRGDLLIVYENYSQSVKMTDDRHFELMNDVTTAGVIDDIISSIAWDIISKKGKVFFASKEEMGDLYPIALKTRY